MVLGGLTGLAFLRSWPMPSKLPIMDTDRRIEERNTMRYGITFGAIIVGMAFAGCEPTEVQGVSSDATCDIDYGVNLGSDHLKPT